MQSRNRRGALNRRVLAVTIVVLMVGSAAVFGIHWFQFNRQSVFFGGQADTALAEEDFGEAIRLYRQALQMEPKSVPILMGLAESYERVGDATAAYTMAQRVERLQTGSRENQLRLARVSLQLQRFGDAITRIESLIDSAGNPESPAGPEGSSSSAVNDPEVVGDVPAELLMLLGDAKFGNRDQTGAIEAYRESIATGEADVGVYARLAEILLRESADLEGSREVIDQMVTTHPVDPAALMARGRWNLVQVDMPAQSATDPTSSEPSPSLAAAAEDADRAIELSDEGSDLRREALIFSATVANRSDDFKRVESLTEHGIGEFPESSELYRLAYAGLAAQAARAADSAERDALLGRARQILESGVAKNPRDPSLLWTLASDHLEHNRVDAAQAVTNQLRNLRYSPPLINYLDARIAAMGGDVNKAASQLDKVRSDVIETPELVRLVDLTLADLYGKMGDYDRQIAVLRRVVDNDKFWIPGREKLAFAFLQAGRVDEAVQEYRLVTERPGLSIQAPMNFARLLLMQNLSRGEDQRDWSRMEQIFQQLEGNESLEVDLALLRAEMFIARQNPDAARQALSAAPADSRSWSARILLEIAQQQFSAAAEIAQQAETALGDNPSLRYARANLVVATNHENLQSELKTLADVPAGWTDDQKFELASFMVPLLISSGALDTAATLAELAADLRPSDVTSRLQMMQIAFESGNVEKLRQTLTTLEKVAGRDARWYYGGALAWAMSGVPDDKTKTRSATRPSMEGPIDSEANAKAQEYLAEAAVLRPDWSLIPAFSAMLHDRSGNIESAIVKYGEAVDLGWRNPSTIRRFISLLTKQERFGEADSVIRRLRGGNQPFTSDMARIASEVSVEMADLNRAVQLAGEAASESQSADDYLWLAQLSEMIGDSGAAETAYKNAIESASGSTRPTFAWIGFLEGNSRLGEAREALTELEQDVHQDDAAAMLSLAEGYHRIGSADDAARVLKLVSNDQFEGLDGYQRYYAIERAVLGSEASRERLRGWVGAKSQLDAKTLNWARRQLALDLAATGDAEQFAESTSLIQQNLDAGVGSATAEISPTIEDRRAQAIINSIYLGSTQPNLPLEQFQSLQADGWSPSLMDQFTIGQLTAATGDWAAGRRLMFPLLSNDELRKPIHVKTYIRLLLSQGDAAEADLWVDRLQESGIRDEDTAQLTAEVLLRRGRYDRLLDLLTVAPTDVVNRDPQTQWFATTLGLAKRFQLLTQFTTRLGDESEGVDHDPVVERFQNASDQMAASMQDSGDFPGAFYAVELLRRGDCEAAAAAIEKAAKDTPKDQMVAFADLALASPACRGFFQQLEEVYRKLGGADPTNIVYAVVIARLREARGDYDNAQKTYEAILRHEPGNFAVNNNLATLLSLRNADTDKAFFHIQKAIDAIGETLVTLDTRGVVRMVSGDIDGAKADFAAALTQFPHPAVLFHQAQAELAGGDPIKAKDLFERAIQVGLQPGDLHPLEMSSFQQLQQRFTPKPQS